MATDGYPTFITSLPEIDLPIGIGQQERKVPLGDWPAGIGSHRPLELFHGG